MKENKYPFQYLNIFEDNRINALCDAVSQKVKDITGAEPVVCGSLSKIFAGTLPQDYRPKDIDFVVSQWNFRKLRQELHNIKHIIMIEKLPHKMILYTEYFICMEIWFQTALSNTMKQYYYKHLIPYLYGDKI